ncbi:MAG: hypothetical protein QMC70_03250 [Bacteroidia bacterium]
MRTSIFYALLLVALSSMGQTSLGIIVEPTLNVTHIGFEPKNLSDSFSRMKSHGYTVGFGIEIRKNINRFQSYSIIPGFHQTNILTELENLQFMDVIHPQLPEIRDLAFAATKRAEIRYRQMYLGSQFLYNKQLQVSGINSKLKLNIGGGLGAFFLVSHNAKVKTEGFAINGNYTTIIKDSTGIEINPFLFQALLIADLTMEVLPSTILVAGIKATLPITATTSSQPKMTVWTPALRIGIRRIL